MNWPFGLALAYGVVGVNLVASEADRAMIGELMGELLGCDVVGVCCTSILGVAVNI